jgi:hypothetical protein
MSRRMVGLLALHGTLIAGWLGLACWVAPPLIIAALEGRSIGILNRLMQGMGSGARAEPTLKAWRELSWAVAIAGLLHLSIVLLIDRLDHRRTKPAGAGSAALSRATNFALGLLALAFLAGTILKGTIQDYHFYLAMWREVRLGHDPWFLVVGVFGKYPLNAYGPLFNVLAIPAWINPLLPKLLFAYSYLLLAVWLIKDGGAGRLSGAARLLLLVWFFCPYAWVEIPVYGHFDVLVGLFCVGAVLARVHRRDIVSGLCLALGVLLKYIPIVLLPFLILDRGPVRFRLLIAAVGGILLGLGTSTVLWGSSTFRPLLFAAERSSYHLSIYRFLKGPYSPLKYFNFNENLDQWAVPILFVTLLLAWSWSRRNAIDPATSSVLAILVTLMFYQVGFAQYQMVLFVLASYWVVLRGQDIAHRTLVEIALGLYYVWLSIFDLVYFWIGIDNTSMQQWVGLPTFLLGCLLAVCILISPQPSATLAPGAVPAPAATPTPATATTPPQRR